MSHKRDKLKLRKYTAQKDTLLSCSNKIRSGMVSIPDKSLLTWNAPKTTTLQAKEMAPHCNSTANNPVPEFPAITKCSHPPHTQNYKKKFELFLNMHIDHGKSTNIFN